MAKATRNKLTEDSLLQAIASFDPPWADRPPLWGKFLSQLLDFDAVAFAVLRPDAVAADSFLLVDGLDDQQVDAWCQSDLQHDPILQQSMRHGVHQGHDEPNSLLSGHSLAAALPACYQRQTWWWLIVSRNDRPYQEQEQILLATLLRHFVARFDNNTEPTFRRLLLDHQQDILHADVVMCMYLAQHPELTAQIKTEILPVIQQRWKKLADHQDHHLFLNINGRPTWVRFRPGHLNHNDRRHWYLELRPLEETDPPPLGLVEDPRVGLALGFLSDHFQKVPALAEVARQVQTSPFHFHRLFTRQAGISPKHFVLRNQLLHAKHQLLATRIPIGNIARSCGFVSHGHFTATFNRIVGQSPSEFREHH